MEKSLYARIKEELQKNPELSILEERFTSNYLAELDELIQVKEYIENFHLQILFKNLAALGRFKDIILLKKKFGIEPEKEIVEQGLKNDLG